MFKRILKIISGMNFYSIVCVSLVNLFLVFLVANMAIDAFVGDIITHEDRLVASHEGWQNAYSLEFLRTVYPRKSDAEILDVIEMKSWRGLTYEPFYSWRNEPGIMRLTRNQDLPKNADSNIDWFIKGKEQYQWWGIHEAGFRFIGKEQGPWPPSPKSLNVFVFGGSTTAGSGVSDARTIPAFMQKIIRIKFPDIDVNVYNFGTGGHFSAQERAFFIQLLLNKFIPDFAVFIDGFNDSMLWTGDPGLVDYIAKFFLRDRVEGFEHAPSYYLTRTFQSTAFYKYVKSFAPKPSLENFGASGLASDDEELKDLKVINDIIHRYEINKKVVEAAGRSQGVKTLFIWQPVSTYKYDGPFPKGEIKGQARRAKFLYPQFKKFIEINNMETNFIWCADIQKGIAENLYVDQGIHYNSKGNELVANCVVDGMIRSGLL